MGSKAMWETDFLSGSIFGAALTSLASFIVFQVGRADRRFTVYDGLRKSFDEAGEYSSIFHALHLIDDERHELQKEGRQCLANVKVEIRHGFLALMERIALAWRSGLVNIRVLNYNFGYYMILAYDTDEMWPDDGDREHPYYASLANFVERLRDEKKRLYKNRAKYIRGVRMGGWREFPKSPFS